MSRACEGYCIEAVSWAVYLQHSEALCHALTVSLLPYGMKQRSIVSGASVALLAGALGAFVGLAGKVAGRQAADSFQNVSTKGILYIVMMILNFGMMTAFTSSLETLTSLTATSLSTTSNIVVSGTLSAVVYGHRISWKWILGSTLLVMGTVLVTTSQAKGASVQPEPAAPACSSVRKLKAQ